MGYSIKKGLKILATEGPMTFFYKVKLKLKDINGKSNPYQTWIKENEKDIMKVYPLDYNPLISIVVPVFNVKSNQLIECIESVEKQTYTNWELCLVDDASTWENVRKTLKKYESNNKVKIVYRKENGHISKSTNDGIEIASGEFIAFLDCDDCLASNALFEMAKKLNEDKNYDFIYSDEDKITENGKARHMPHFKPDWSPDTLMSHMYTCHFAIYRKNLVDKTGGLRCGYEGAQDYDFTLRFTELTSNIGHISKILYHWRERKESTAINPEAKPYIFEAAKKSKEDALKRRGLVANLEFIKDINQYRVNYINMSNPIVSIIIPSKDNYEIILRCVESIVNITQYKNYEIIIIDNGSASKIKDKYEDMSNKYNCKYCYQKMDFNFSRMCNLGETYAKGELLLFLNDDIEVIDPEWLGRMVGQASLMHTGAVGAKLLYPDSATIQHTGVINIATGPVHYLSGYDDKNIYYFGRNVLDYNCCAVTAACLMVSRDKFHEVNGFNEKLAVAYNDVDFCFKLIEAGYYNIARTDVILYHHESFSRGNDLISDEKLLRLENERERLYKMHPEFRGKDLFYSPNLTQCRNDFSLNINYNKNEYNGLRKSKKTYRLDTSNRVEYCIDLIDISESIYIEGWAFKKHSIFPNLNVKKIVLKDKEKNYIIIDTVPVYRPDVTVAYGNKKNYNFSGFKCNFKKESLSSGKYEIYIYLNKYLNFKRLFNSKRVLDVFRDYEETNPS